MYFNEFVDGMLRSSMSLLTLVAWLIQDQTSSTTWKKLVAMNLSKGVPSERILDALMVYCI